ncbi:unnamed protein product [Ceratitis capitata]|uniref:(Mediterranean fruit fly) hypothetical protein n=1 Tax=Ceratitis capitata TaxID=7213 RepID=A0A811UH77_CERCA|nr:unnamed protein product [Ceratitis capitata]
MRKRDGQKKYSRSKKSKHTAQSPQTSNMTTAPPSPSITPMAMEEDVIDVAEMTDVVDVGDHEQEVTPTTPPLLAMVVTPHQKAVITKAHHAGERNQYLSKW